MSVTKILLLLQIDRLKIQLTQQESSKQAQNEELASLKEQLETLRKEEREYKLKVDASKAELEKLQKANLSLQGDMSQVGQTYMLYCTSPSLN